MVCPKCGSENVTVQMVEVGSKTAKKGNGVLGHVNNTARTLTALSTFGMSNLVWKKSKGNEKNKNHYRKNLPLPKLWELLGNRIKIPAPVLEYQSGSIEGTIN